MLIEEDFKNKFKEFSSEQLENLPTLIDIYQCIFNYDYDTTNSCNKKAILYLLAHLLTINYNPSYNGIGSRNTTGMSVGNVSISFSDFSNPSKLTDFFGNTLYGQIFLMLINNRIGAIFV